jgi:hypothetical protein
MWNHYELKFELIQPILGTIPKDRKVFENFVMDQAKTEMEKGRAAEDADRVPQEVESRGWTGFYEDDEGHPILMDYQFKGFLKNAGNILKGVVGTKTTKVKNPKEDEPTTKTEKGISNLRSHVENTVFVSPRYIQLAEKVDDVLERPLRAMTMQGPRVSVMRSDMINPGHQYTLELRVLEGSVITEKVLADILSYGESTGLLQWRNGGYGRFKVVSLTKK